MSFEISGVQGPTNWAQYTRNVRQTAKDLINTVNDSDKKKTYDLDNNGKLSKDEFKAVLNAQGFSSAGDNAAKLEALFEAVGNGKELDANDLANVLIFADANYDGKLTLSSDTGSEFTMRMKDIDAEKGTSGSTNLKDLMAGYAKDFADSLKEGLIMRFSDKSKKEDPQAYSDAASGSSFYTYANGSTGLNDPKVIAFLQNDKVGHFDYSDFDYSIDSIQSSFLVAADTNGDGKITEAEVQAKEKQLAQKLDAIDQQYERKVLVNGKTKDQALEALADELREQGTVEVPEGDSSSGDTTGTTAKTADDLVMEQHKDQIDSITSYLKKEYDLNGKKVNANGELINERKELIDANDQVVKTAVKSTSIFDGTNYAIGPAENLTVIALALKQADKNLASVPTDELINRIVRLNADKIKDKNKISSDWIINLNTTELAKG